MTEPAKPSPDPSEESKVQHALSAGAQGRRSGGGAHQREPYPRGARGFVLAVALVVIVVVGLLAGGAKPSSGVDRVFFWAFMVFSVGFAELFLLFLGLAILGRIDLAKVFQDKEMLPKGTQGGAPSVSLSRLQAFMWTLVMMVVFFHQAVTHEGIPSIPPEMLLVMGISGTVYLAGKNLSIQHGEAAAPPAAGKDGGQQ